jgi:hypothetical protein
MATTPEPTAPLEDDEASASRRKFLRRGAAAAAAAAAAGVTMSTPAGAANGSNLIIGQANTGTATTTLSGSQFRVTGGNGGISLFGANFTNNGIGVYGSAGDTTNVGTGVFGTSGNGSGVFGRGTTGVHGEGGTSTVRGIGLRGTASVGPQLKLDVGAGNGPPGGAWARGEFFTAANGLFYATQTGTGAGAGWVRLSSVLQPLASPVRAYDSRPGQLPVTGPKTQITAGVNRDIDLTGAGLLATTAKAALVNLTVTNTSAGGFLKVFQKGAAVPTASNINWSSAGLTLANSTFVALDANGFITVRCGGTGAATDFIVDILAFTF